MNIGELSSRLVLTVDELVALEGMPSRPVVYRELSRYLDSGGEAGLPARRLGRRIVIPVPELLAWLGLEQERGAPLAAEHPSTTTTEYDAVNPIT